MTGIHASSPPKPASPAERRPGAGRRDTMDRDTVDRDTVDRRTVETPHGVISVLRRGAGDPLVLLHPLALSATVWGEFAALLAAHHEVLAVDVRGHGASTWDRTPFTVEDLAADLRLVLDGLDIPSAHLLGMSMGGSIAVTFAGLFPERVDRLVVADSTAWYGDEARQTWAERARRAHGTPRTRQVPFQVDRWFTERHRALHPESVADVVRCFLATDGAVHAAASVALGELDSRHLLPRVQAPTLLLTGEEDYATPPAMAEQMADAIPDASSVTLPRLRHLSLIERPSLADVVRRHLRGEPVRTDDVSTASGSDNAGTRPCDCQA